MACNQNTCSDYTPDCSESGQSYTGVTMTKEIWPGRDTSRITVPSWARDRVMYSYEDRCEYPGFITGGLGLFAGFNFGDVDNTGVNSGKCFKNLAGSSNWWDSSCGTRTSGRGDSFPALKYRYWDFYPSEISFEPNYSDSWWYYLYDTSQHAVGKPCYALCYYEFAFGAGGGGDTSSLIIARENHYDCDSSPDETYIKYECEDGKITDYADEDPYPLIWTAGTKRQGIAFRYTGTELTADIEMMGIGTYNITDASDYSGVWFKVFDKTTGHVTITNTTYSKGFGLYTEPGSGEGLFNEAATSKTRQTVTAQIEGTSITLNCTIKPVKGKRDGVTPDSEIRINSISGYSGELPIVGQEYILKFPNYKKRRNPYATTAVAKVRFSNITAANQVANAPIGFRLAEAKNYDSYRGGTLDASPYKTAWNGGEGIAYQSAQGNAVWSSPGTVVYKDFDIPKGTKIRMRLESRWNTDTQTYNTLWKVDKVVEYGKNYNAGDGVNFVNQEVYYLYYPSADATNKISIGLMISQTDNVSRSIIGKYVNNTHTVNGWTFDNVRHTEDDFNMHFATIKGGSAAFTKDGLYTCSNGAQIKVVAGWGIKDRAIIMGYYEFLNKEIEYAIGVPTPGVPFDPELVKPECEAKIVNGRLDSVKVIKPGYGLSNPNIEAIRLIVDAPPTLYDHDKYSLLIRNGANVLDAISQSKGIGEIAEVKPIISDGQLISVRVIKGGSGYSSTNPPKIKVPYVAKKVTEIVKEGQTVDKGEADNKILFEDSPIYQKIKNTPYSDVQVTNVDNGKPYVSGSKPSSGYSWNTHTTVQTEIHKEKSYTFNRPDVEQLKLSTSKRTVILEKTGVEKTFVDQFKPIGKGRTSPNSLLQEQIDLKTKSIQPPDVITNARKDIEGTTTVTSSSTNSLVSLSAEQASVVDSTPINLSVQDYGDNRKIENPDFDESSKSYINQVNSAKNIKVSNYSSEYYPTEIKSFHKNVFNNQKTTYVDATPDRTAGNQFGTAVLGLSSINITQASGSTPKTPTENYDTFSKALDENDANSYNNLTELHERDNIENRTKQFSNSELRVVQGSFFSLPCASSTEKYLIRRYCPDPRQHTFITVRLGVYIQPNELDTEVGRCLQCVKNMTSVQAVKSQMGSGFTWADAFCNTQATPGGVVTYTKSGTASAGTGSYNVSPTGGSGSGLKVLVSKSGGVYTVNISSAGSGYAVGNLLTVPGASLGGSTPGNNLSITVSTVSTTATMFPWWTSGGGGTGYSNYSLVQSYYGMYIYEGIHSWEIYGNLEILHDLSGEAKTFSNAIDSYGNPYDFMCGRYYGDLQEDYKYDYTSASESYDPDAPNPISNPTPDNG